ncbi:uncharacterized protein LOC119576262 [Penaeus monodon]|uniref:uncharacterized protein LOC119576262 n=1 Tax=Penaeus monodon TaxID=6687 RepID=UPI0018A7E130|nr:uncharacterized protein LOC119576262 [Penaeus monodon]
MNTPGIRFLLALLMAGTAVALASDCSSSCTCKWKQGKETAECHNQGLQTLPAHLEPSTQVIDLSYNNIQRLPSQAFLQEKLTNLQKIYLISCNVQEIDNEAFQELSNLVEIDLSMNLLKRIPSQAFKHTPELRELYLQGNSIQHIELGSFSHLQSLKSLDLSNCNITTIAARAFEPLRMLEKLKLHANKLTTLQPRLVESLQNLHLVTVHDNPWICDCRLRKLREWLVVTRAPHTISPVCSSPPRVQGQNFDSMDEDQLACPPEILPTGRKIESVAGDNATIWCPVGGLPTPGVTWYVRDIAVENGSIVGGAGAQGYILNEATEERGSLLVIADATVQDSGLNIRCVASNAAGSASATFILTVSNRVSGLAGFSADKIAAISSVFVVVVALLIGFFSLLARRRNSHTPVPIKTVTVNGATESRIADLPYTPSAYVGGSVVAPSDNPDLLCEAEPNSEVETADGCTTDEGSQHSLCSNTPRLNGHSRSHTVSLDGDSHKAVTCPYDSMWAPERVHAMLDSAAPEHVMHTSLHEPLTPNCDALVQQRLLSSSQRHLNNRLSYLPDFAPDYSELYSFSQVGPGQTYTSMSGVHVPHYGTIPRSMKTRSSAPEIIPGDGTPTLTRHSRAWHYGSEGTPLMPLEQRGGTVPLNPAPPTTAANTCLPSQPLQSHSSKLSRITARDSPDEGYQEGADV